MKKINKGLYVDTRVIVFTTLFCKRLNMSNIVVDDEHTLWVQLSFLQWLGNKTNSNLRGYDKIVESMDKFIDGCFV